MTRPEDKGETSKSERAVLPVAKFNSARNSLLLLATMVNLHHRIMNAGAGRENIPEKEDSREEVEKAEKEEDEDDAEGMDRPNPAVEKLAVVLLLLGAAAAVEDEAVPEISSSCASVML